jgi:hypothetical protein
VVRVSPGPGFAYGMPCVWLLGTAQRVGGTPALLKAEAGLGLLKSLQRVFVSCLETPAGKGQWSAHVKLYVWDARCLFGCFGTAGALAGAPVS